MRFLGRFLLALLISMVPFAVLYAAGGLVPCDGPECDICSIVALAQKIMQFLIAACFILATIMFVWAGITILTNADNPGKRSEGKSMFANVLIGFIILLAAWLIVDTVMKVLFVNSDINKASVGRPWQDILCSFRSQTPLNSTDTTGGSTSGDTSGAVSTAPPQQPQDAGRTLGQLNSADLANAASAENSQVSPMAAQTEYNSNVQLYTSSQFNLPEDQAEQEALARGILETSGVSVNNDPCPAGGGTGCTDLAYMQRDTINAITQAATGCGCEYTVTGGTELEGGHTCPAGDESHCSGYKFDARPSPQLDSYVQKMQPLAVRSDGSPQYMDPQSGEIWAKETTPQGVHWDVLVPPKKK
jgi:hypothetical protein